MLRNLEKKLILTFFRKPNGLISLSDVIRQYTLYIPPAPWLGTRIGFLQLLGYIVALFGLFSYSPAWGGGNEQPTTTAPKTKPILDRREAVEIQPFLDIWLTVTSPRSLTFLHL